MNRSYSSNKLKFDNIILGFNSDGIAYSDCNNIEMKNDTDPKQNNYDPRETSWFKETQLISENQNTYNDLQRNSDNGILVLQEEGLQYSKQICQQSMKYGRESYEFSHISCININQNSLQDYFKNLSNNGIRQFIVQPISQMILFDSFNNSSLINQNFASQKFINNSIEQQQYQNSIKSYQSNHYKSYKTLDKIELSKIYFQPIQLSQKTNDQELVILINPIYIIDRYIPYDSLDGKFIYELKIAFLHNTVFSIQFLLEQQNNLQSIYQKYFIIVCIIITIVAIFSFFTILIYSIKIQLTFNKSIDHLIGILTIIQEDIQNMESIKSYDFQDQFLSFETHKLYQSFKELYFILLSTSENFYKDNSTETLLKLHKNIEYFKQFGNYQAIGVTYNNIGSIFLQQGHYFQAMEQFQKAIIYAKYNISDYCKLNPLLANSEILALYCFDKIQMTQNCNINSQHLNQDKQQPIKIISRNQILSQATNSSPSNRQNKFSIPEIVRQLSTKHSSVIKQQQQEESDQIIIKELNNIEIELLTTLFYRKRNFIYSILEFQEHCDQKKTSNNYSDQYNYNFWQEIKVLLKKLLKLARLLPLSQQYEIGIQSHIAKCQFQIGKPAKSLQTLDKCKILLKQLQAEEFKNKGQSQISPNIQANKILDQNLLNRYILGNQQNKQQQFTIKYNQRSSILTLPSSGRSRNSTISIFNKQKIFNLNEKNSEKQNFQLLNQEIIDYNKRDSSTSQTRRHNSFYKEFQVNSPILNQILPENNFLQFKTQNQTYQQNQNQSKQILFKNNLQSVIQIEVKEQSQIKSFDQSQVQQEKQIDSLTNFEIYFQNLRRNDTLFQDDALAMNYVSVDTLDSKIKFTQAEYFLQYNNYREAALILRNLLEDKKIFMSHFPRKIVDLLRQIIIQSGAKSQEFNQVYNKFNPTISLNIGIIFSCSNNNQSITKSLQLTSNLVSNILTQKKDQFGIILVNEEENQIQTYLSSILTSQINGMMGKVLQDIQNIVSSKQVKYIFEYSETIQTKDDADQDREFNQGNNFLSLESKNKTSQNSAARQNIFFNGCNKVPLLFNNKDLLIKTDQSTNKCINPIFNEPKLIDDTESVENSPEANFREENWVSKKIKQPKMPSNLIKKRYQISEDNENLTISILDNIETNRKLKSNHFNKQNNGNYHFHMSMRKAIKELFIYHADYVYSKKIFSNAKNYEINFSSDYLKLDQQYKFLIYCTDQIEITKNELLDNLFHLLYQLDIQLIIYSIKKGNNFLENLPDLTYQQNHKEIVRIFYSNTKLINYLMSQRDIFSKCAYPTIIQHY